MPTPLLDSQSGNQLTINEFVKDPLLIQAAVIDIMNQGFLVDSVLRNAGAATGGLVGYRSSEPLYADDDVQTIEEFAELPILETSLGTPETTYVEEKGGSIVVSDRMIRRLTIDPVQRQLMKLRNTMVKNWDGAWLNSLLTNPGVNTYACPTHWASTSANPRDDVLSASYLVETAYPPGTDSSQQFGWEPDTLIIGKDTKSSLIQNTSFSQPYVGNIASESLQYTGKLPQQIFGLDVLVTSRMPAGHGIVMQRNICGFIADELPLTVTPTYRDEPRKMWRADVQRASAFGMDQPTAVTVLSGLS